MRRWKGQASSHGFWSDDDESLRVCTISDPFRRHIRWAIETENTQQRAKLKTLVRQLSSRQGLLSMGEDVFRKRQLLVVQWRDSALHHEFHCRHLRYYRNSVRHRCVVLRQGPEDIRRGSRVRIGRFDELTHGWVISCVVLFIDALSLCIYKRYKI